MTNLITKLNITIDCEMHFATVFDTHKYMAHLISHHFHSNIVIKNAFIDSVCM